MMSLMEQQVIERDFYFKRAISRSDTLKYAGITILANFIAYYFVFCVNYFLAILEGSASYVLLQIILFIPICAVVPSLLVYQYVRHFVPQYFSLADTPDTWRKKALQWVGIGELLRLLLGLVPLSITKFGASTSPLTYHLYTFVYVMPTDRFDTIMLDGGSTFADIAVFLIIYILYFALYSFLLSGKIKKEIARHQMYLEGCLKEKERFYDFNKKRRMECDE